MTQKYPQTCTYPKKYCQIFSENQKKKKKNTEIQNFDPKKDSLTYVYNSETEVIPLGHHPHIPLVQFSMTSVKVQSPPPPRLHYVVQTTMTFQTICVGMIPSPRRFPPPPWLRSIVQFSTTFQTICVGMIPSHLQLLVVQAPLLLKGKITL